MINSNKSAYQIAQDLDITGAGSFDYYYLGSSTPFFITPHQNYSVYLYSFQSDIINSTIEAGGVIIGDAGSLQNGANKQINYTIYSPSSNKTNTANTDFQTGIKETNNTSTAIKEVSSASVNDVQNILLSSLI